MKTVSRNKLFLASGLLILALIVMTSVISRKRVDFSTEVKPLFNKKCLSCHGGVKKEGGFSLLFQEEALDTTDSGMPAIIPGHPEKSELIRRLTSKDPEERMPYNHDPLSDQEIDLLKRWIKEGAVWGEHWAYVPVKETPLPNAAGGFFSFFKKKNDWIKNGIDHFILDKLDEEGLTPAGEADKATLLRRVSLDITGVPAPELLAQQFLNDNSPEAYEKLVDSLLASPRYGERWTAMWLDIARYADSKGYEKDSYRSIWRYRDWLIKAFNKDMPYDRFLTEQLAGDLLPDATDEQFIATAFNRNTMNNDEGGTDNEEFRTAAVIDRVNTTWETVLGTTFACVQCHSHPYDPFKQEEYYKFMAFFNNTRDEDVPGEYPILREFNDADQEKLKQLQDWLQKHASAEQSKEVITFVKTLGPSINAYHADEFTNSELAEVYLALRKDAVCRLPDINLTNRTKLTYRYASGVDNGVWTIRLDSTTGPVIATTKVLKTKRGWWGWEINTIDIKPPVGGVHDLYFTYSNPGIEKGNAGNLMVFEWFYFGADFPGKGAPGYDSAYKYYNDLVQASPAVTTPIMMDNPEDRFRATHIFERGNWMAKTAEVQPDVPHSLNPLPEGAPRNRMGLAMWLTDKNNPLTSRTLVNRMWEQVMGQGIVETLEDMGTQGISPTHQNLLDWLSYRLMNEFNWSLKKLLKEIVMSATYRQDSRVTEEVLEKDPFNKYYARGPRVRLSAEQVRDQALAVSGLLSDKMYGKSVMPYQPDRIWLAPYDGATWKMSEGEDRYRRAIYTYWRRSSPYPSMISFDGVAREVCQARRIRTNTPLQALTTLNDFAFVEMARNFAIRMQNTGGTVRDQIAKGYEMALYQPIAKEKLDALEKLYNDAVESYKENREEACKMIGDDQREDNPEKAALVLVANAMLNLDDLITKN